MYVLTNLSYDGPWPSSKHVMYPSPIGPSHLAMGHGGGEREVQYYACMYNGTCNMVRPIWQQDMGAEREVQYYACMYNVTCTMARPIWQRDMGRRR